MAVCISQREEEEIEANLVVIGIAPKVTQSVLTAAFLFAFKDVLYEYTVKLRRTTAATIRKS